METTPATKQNARSTQNRALLACAKVGEPICRCHLPSRGLSPIGAHTHITAPTSVARIFEICSYWREKQNNTRIFTSLFSDLEPVAIKIQTEQSATDIARIETLQWKHRLQFPQSYVEFLLRNNGGKPVADFFEFADGSDASVVDRFLSVGGPNYADLDWHLETYNGRIPKEFFPIAKDPGGGLIVMGWDSSFKDQIFFWDHEFEAEHNEEATMSNMHFIAPDLSHFLQSLSVLELE